MTGLPANAAPQAVAPEEVSDGGIADIVVTAQKREQNLQDVPVSISAVSEATIIANKIQDVSDLSRIAPNLTIREGAGGSKIPQYILRGIYTFGSALGTDKGVSLYIDGVYIQNVAGSIFEFADIQRIEVLRGPQGTLFGRNSTGGAISVITRDPTGEFGVRQDLTYGNLNQFRSKTRVDLPQFGPFSISASYLHSERQGEVRNLGAGTVFDHGPATGGRYGRITSPKRLGDENVEGVFVAVKADLLDDLDLSYKFDYSENDYTPTAVGLSSYLPGVGAAAFGGIASLAPFAASVARRNELPVGLRTPLTKKRPGAVNNAFTQPAHSEAYGHNFTARYRISDSLSVRNILSFRHAKLDSPGFQLDGQGGLIGGFSNAAGGAANAPFIAPGTVLSPFLPAAAAVPVGLVVNNAGNRQRQWSNEFQINYDSELLTLTAGAIHFHDNQKTQGFPGEYSAIQFAAIAGQNTTGVNAAGSAAAAFVIPSNTGYERPRVKVNSDAAFAQAEFHVTDKIDLVGGVRVTHDKKDGLESFPGSVGQVTLVAPIAPPAGTLLLTPVRLPGATADIAAGTALPALLPVGTVIRGAVTSLDQQRLFGAPGVPIRYRDTRATYLIGANYKPNSDLLFYAKYVTGYISGGQLATISFDPETAKSYEAGIKADLFDRRLRSNLALFHVKYRSVQQATLGTLTGVLSATPFAQAIVPATDARAYGFEWENTVAPLEGVVLQANVGYLDFDYRGNQFAGFVFTAGAPGIKEFQRPKWTLNLSGSYETPEVLAGGHLMFRADAAWKSRTLLSNDITPGVGPTALEDPALTDANTVPASWTVNGRVALEGFALGGAKATLAAFGKNIFNNRNIVQSTNLGFQTAVIYERARTYGVDLSIEF